MSETPTTPRDENAPAARDWGGVAPTGLVQSFPSLGTHGTRPRIVPVRMATNTPMRLALAAVHMSLLHGAGAARQCCAMTREAEWASTSSSGAGERQVWVPAASAPRNYGGLRLSTAQRLRGGDEQGGHQRRCIQAQAQTPTERHTETGRRRGGETERERQPETQAQARP